jgi:DNA-binding NtrC family response regulator/CHASE2 domain-containing sensor protein
MPSLHRPVVAAAIGVSATMLALGVLLLGASTITPLEWSVHDHWIRHSRSASPALVVVARDAASDARLGAGALDRAVLARLITGLSRAGAAAVGVDVTLERPSAPGRGGAASDALLGQAVALAGNVVIPVALELVPDHADGQPILAHRSWLPLSDARPVWPRARAVTGAPPALVERAEGVGHTLAPTEADGVVRKVPLFVRLGDRAVPAFGLALATAFMSVRPDGIVVDRGSVAIARAGSRTEHIPVDGQGRALVDFATPIHTVSLLDVWRAIEEGQAAALQDLVEGKVVLLLAEPSRTRQLTPVGSMSDVRIQAHLLNTELTGSWLRPAPIGWAALGTVVLAGLTAWLWLALPWWSALAGVALLVLAHAVALALAPALAGILLPVWLPLASIVLSSAGALLWSQLTSADRIWRLQGEVGEVREALIQRESTVEALEEDLETARSAVARSTRAEDGLRAELARARAEEERTRQRLDDLDREFRALRPAESRPASVQDAERERLRHECERLGIVTGNPSLLAMFGDLEKAARSGLPILLTGEPGTGKELFARAAHRQSPRAGGPFVGINMAAVSPELFESELFGHVRGSFTGAVGERKGYFEQADRGTLFLDEIGELRPEHQSKLLRVLQEHCFYPVGATRPRTVDVRVVAASNRDLERGIADGWFREDLYFRLKGFTLRLPPLRERRDDIAPLAARFVAEAAMEMGRPDLRLSEAALAALERHDWPGNVRELSHCLRQAAALARGTVITVEDLRLPSSEPRRDDGDSDATVLGCLRQHGFDMQATARGLGWDRSTVTQRLKGLGFRALVEAGGDRARAALALAGDPALGRTVELKLREYHEHLLRAIQEFHSAEAAVAACRRRFKNLPERHFRYLELLVRQQFEPRPPTTTA